MTDINLEVPNRSNLGISGATLMRVRRKQTELAPMFGYSAPSQDELVNLALDCLDKYGVVKPENSDER